MHKHFSLDCTHKINQHQPQNRPHIYIWIAGSSPEGNSGGLSPGGAIVGEPSSGQKRGGGRVIMVLKWSILTPSYGASLADQALDCYI